MGSFAEELHDDSNVKPRTNLKFRILVRTPLTMSMQPTADGRIRSRRNAFRVERGDRRSHASGGLFNRKFQDVCI